MRRDTYPEYQVSTNTGEALLDEIIMHRRVELWGEDFGFYDLKRWNEGLDRTGSNHQPSIAITMEVAPDGPRWQWLLPRTEIDIADGVIEQNP